MKPNSIALLLTVIFFFVVGFLILKDQFDKIGVWFQVSDIHHETFALMSFALAIGTIIGASLQKVVSAIKYYLE